MPIYEYSCAKCGKTIEVIQKFSDKPLKKHEKCGGTLSKLISASSFHLKGTGWYKTDYAPKTEATKTDATKEESTNGKKDKEGKTETKADKASTSSDSSTASPAPGKKEKPTKSSAPKN